MMEPQSDSGTRLSLLSRLRNDAGDQGAWNEFVHRYAPVIHRWCLHWRLQESDAWDVTQNVLLKLVEKMRTFHYDPQGSFRAWLKTLTKHAWSDYVARQQRPGRGEGATARDELLLNVSAAEDLAAQLREQFDLELWEEAPLRVQGRVDAKSWEVFQFTAKEEVAGAEVAARLGMTVAAVFWGFSIVL